MDVQGLAVFMQFGLEKQKVELQQYGEGRPIDQFLKLSHFYRIFYQTKQCPMLSCSSAFPLAFQPQFQPITDIFSKYTDGSSPFSFPFKLFQVECRPNPNKKKTGARGPYRKYTQPEKLFIIKQMLQGETLKIIAERTQIPKRNLIRWKHEYLVSQKKEAQLLIGEDQSIQLESGSNFSKKIVLESKQSLSTESIQLIRIK